MWNILITQLLESYQLQYLKFSALCHTCENKGMKITSKVCPFLMVFCCGNRSIFVFSNVEMCQQKTTTKQFRKKISNLTPCLHHYWTGYSDTQTFLFIINFDHEHLFLTSVFTVSAAEFFKKTFVKNSCFIPS